MVYCEGYRLTVPLAGLGSGGDGLAAWAEAYFRFEVTTSASSQAVQRGFGAWIAERV
jgi:hypothetical protein